ncbi:MAG: VgrG-related protein [Cyanobacteria bacterium J06639_14]
MSKSTYIAEPLLKLDGESAPIELTNDILEILIEESLHLPGAFTLMFRNSALPGQESSTFWQHQDQFEIGGQIEIGFRSNATESKDYKEQTEGIVLKGEITAIEAHFTAGAQAPIIVRGYDVSHRLHRGRFNRSFQNITDSDILKKIAAEVGMSTGTVDDSGVAHDYLFQANQTNMEFLRDRAARNGFELFTQNGELQFRQPQAEESLKLTWLKDLSSFYVRVSSAEQVESVEVRGWDYQQKQPIVATQSSDQIMTQNGYGKGKETSSIFEEKPNSPTMIVVDRPVFNAEEAETMAQALFNELGGEFVQADAQAEGNPQIRPGRIITLEDMNKYDGDYYVTEVRHLFSERVYTTEFSVRGFRDNDLLSILAPQSRLKAGETLLVGIVTDNEDPDGLGRVRVKCPTLTEDHESNWARVIGTGAGSSRGFDCLPEIDDEVLVGFEHGDIHRPYVIGGVWNGKDAPPEKVDDAVAGGKVRLRTFKTRTGHTLQFIEEDSGGSQAGIHMTSVYGHEIYLNDSEQAIVIKTNGGHTLRLCDQTQNIEMSSTGTIAMKAPRQISLTVGTSQVELNPMGVNIRGSQCIMQGQAQATVQGALVNVLASGVATVQGSLLKLC